jgi:hypothetical protein
MENSEVVKREKCEIFGIAEETGKYEETLIRVIPMGQTLSVP